MLRSLIPSRFRLAALLAAVLIVAPTLTPVSVATAQTATRSGAVVVRNTTGREIELRGVSFVDALGSRQELNGAWKLKSGFYGYLGRDGNTKLVARELTLSLVDEDGSTEIRWVANTLDVDGDFVLMVRPEDVTEHRRLLGKTASTTTTSSPWTFETSRGPTQEELGRGVTKVVAAVVAHAIAKDRAENGEGGLFDALLIQVALRTRNEVIQSALTDLFPSLSSEEVSGARLVICLAMDGELSVDRYSQAAARERLAAELRRRDPDFAMAAEVADFIAKVAAAR
jgi:hypothetical protein